MQLARSAIPNLLLYPFLARDAKRPSHPYKKAAIIKLGKLGDAVLSLGAIKHLLDHFGVENCVVVASNFGAALFSHQFPSLEIVTVSTNHSTLRKTLSDLYSLRDHAVFALGVQNLISLQYHRTLHDEILTSRIPAVSSWGMENSELAHESASDQIVAKQFRFDKLGTTFAPQSNSSRELMLHCGLVSPIVGRSISEAEIKPHLIPFNIDGKAAALGLAPFSGSALRDVPWDLIVSACESAARHSLVVHLWSGDKDDARCLDLMSRIEGISDVSVRLIHTPTIGSLIEEIARVRVVFAAESAPAHLAIALDRPFLGIIGGGHFGWFAPWTNRPSQLWLAATQICYACNWHCIHKEPICITQITPEQVCASFENVLAGCSRQN